VTPTTTSTTPIAPQPPLHWHAEDLWLALVDEAPGLTIEVLAETGSTNTTLVERARAGDRSPCLLVAERQTAGRGRLGRPWQSAQDAPGRSLTFSLGLTLAPADWSGLSLAVGLALAEALDPDRALRIGLKWPNDLWLRGADRKLGGILIETLPGADPVARPDERHVVVGVGLNIAPLPADADPADYRSGHVGLLELDPALDAATALHRVAPPLWRALQAHARAGLAPLLPRYAERDVLAGREVQAGERLGTACGIATDGALWLRDAAGTRHAIASGEVSARPRAADTVAPAATAATATPPAAPAATAASAGAPPPPGAAPC
jgi:BirA family biotin operon repressor/biotin-[acetyl-CoA-carboxylase] ligase